MSTQVTEAHRELARNIMFDHTPKGSATAQGVRDAAQLIADSEARATERLRREIDWLQLNNDMLTDDPEKHARAVAERQAIIDERDELRAEAGRLKADGAASAFVNMASRASRAETDRNNLRADLDAIKAILNEEKARAARAEAELAVTMQVGGFDYFTEQRDAAEKRADNAEYLAKKAEAELATERARLDAVIYDCWIIHKGNENAYAVRSLGEYITHWVATPRAAIDAAMKEGAK